jgi:DNA mismatch repair protein MutL
MRPVDHESGAYRVSGYAALPSVAEGSRSRQAFSVNGRWVRAEGLTKGIDDAYRGMVPAGRHPPVALCVEVDPRQVDVNVHPTKQLVRFSDEKGVRLAVGEAVRNAIRGTVDAVPDQQNGRNAESETSSGTSTHPAGEGVADAPLATPERPPTEGHSASEATPPTLPTERSASSDGGDSNVQDGLFGTPERGPVSDPPKVPDLPGQRTEQASAPLSGAGPPAGGGVERGDLPRLGEDLRVVGQIALGYILVDEPQAAWIVDQHVAHERALLDRLADPEDGRTPTVQSLLVPEVVRLSPQDAAEAADSLEELAVYGFEVEPFGKDSFRINGAISTLAQRGDVAGGFGAAVSAMRGTAPGMGREERILAAIACHSAVKLGDRLSHEEMEALIREWLGSRYPATCPHGRSICYRLDHRDIACKLDRH